MGTMIPERFEIRFKKLVDYWSLEAFPQSHRDRAMYRTKDLSAAETEELCNILLDSCERVPSILKIVVASSAIRAKRKSYTPNYESILIPCGHCDGDGLLSASKTINNLEYSYSFKCPSDTCVAAQRIPDGQVAKWSDEFRKEYTPKWDYGKTLTPEQVKLAAQTLKSMGLPVPQRFLTGGSNGQETRPEGRQDQTSASVQADRRREGPQGGAGGEPQSEIGRGRREEEGSRLPPHGWNQEPPGPDL